MFLLALTMSPMFLYAAGATLVGATGIGYALYKLDSRIENRRKHAIEISNQAAQYGFDHTAQILACYATGDYDGMYDKAKEIYAIFKDDDLRVAHVRKLFFGLLERYLKDPARAAEVMAKIDEYRAGEAAKEKAILDNALAKKALADQVAANNAATVAKPAA